jgi:methylenetetrahydrofolate dehydrogenase (NADP+)/methenyltetrahydrofolate cyclohydrolase
MNTNNAVRLDGREIAKRVRSEVKAGVQALQEAGVTTTLAVILVGDDPASHVYVKHKQKDCEKTGIRSIRVDLPATSTTEDILQHVRTFNDDPNVHGILVQMPLPKQCDSERVLAAVSPQKDVDGFHPVNAGYLASGTPRFVPCTPNGVMRLLREYDISTEGAYAVVLGRSQIVGRPMAALLTHANATVTICHSRTRNIEEHVRRADIVIAAVGRPQMVKASWIKPGATVIDVGINRAEDGSLVGDVDYDDIVQVARYATPVPGGVGPMTRAGLLVNTLRAANQLTEAKDHA